MVKKMRSEYTILKEFQIYKEKTEKRMEELERQQNLNTQYERRNSVEISGIPKDIKQAGLEDEVIRIYDAAGVTVHGTNLDKMAIQACHRIGKAQEKVIVKFGNRNFATEGLYSGKNLRGNPPYRNSAVYINNSFCHEFRFLTYVVRKAKKANRIQHYKVRHGVTSIRLQEDGDYFEITHKADLVKHGISIE